MPSRRKNWVARTVVAAILALGVHVVGFVVLVWLGMLELLGAHPGQAPRVTVSAPAGDDSASAANDDRPMEIESLVDELRRPDEKTPEERKREEELKKEEEDKNPHGQVVDLARPAIEQRPDNARFVSEYDVKVEHETRGAHGRDQLGGRAASVPPQGAPDVSMPVPGTTGGPGTPAGKPGKPGPLAMRELDKHRAPPPRDRREGPDAVEHGDAERAGSPPAPARDERMRARAPESGEQGDAAPPGQQGARRGAMPGLPNGKPNLAATPDVLQHAIGKGAGSMDYLKDVDDGEATALNSKRWKHAPFFNRVKRSVANEWHPEAVYMIHDASGHVYGFKDRVTVLRVHLAPDGKLAAWQILQASGVDFLDDEAVNAFRKAAPFPNPPKELVESDGQIHFNFAFIFELSGRGSVKVFKYQ
jgi:TonB family protein